MNKIQIPTARDHSKEILHIAEHESIAKQHARGKKTARERIDLLLDADSFDEIDQLAISPHAGANAPAGDGVVCGFGTINGRTVALYAQDFTILGGSLGTMHAKKIGKVMDMAVKIGCPIIGIIDSGGARIQEGIHALAGYGDIFMRNVRYSGIVPQISIILGPCAGGAVYSPALTDAIFMVENISQMFVTGPQVIKEVLHQDISKEALGGAEPHSTRSGVVTHVSMSEDECMHAVTQFLSYLPDNYKSLPPHIRSSAPTDIDWNTLIPTNMNQAYDAKQVINSIVDDQSFFELQNSFAPNIVIGFARIEGIVVGIVANQTLEKAGTLDIDASCKAARFINLCDNFGIAIVTLVDVPGFLPGVDQEHNGIIRHGAKLLYAYANATVPKITLIMRKAFGGAYIVMGSKHLGADINFAYPMAQIAVLGADAAVSIIHGSKLAKITDAEDRFAAKKSLIASYATEYLNPTIAVEHGYIDAIIAPEETRMRLARALKLTQEKVEKLPPRKQGNIPL